jgi:hypothetical protein
MLAASVPLGTLLSGVGPGLLEMMYRPALR